MRTRPPQLLPRWLRFGALAAALLVGLLGVLQASAPLHAELHADAAHPEHSCAVTLFAAGAEVPVDEVDVVGTRPDTPPLLLPTAPIAECAPHLRLKRERDPPRR